MKELIVIDDFLPEPYTVREAGIGADYIDWTGPDGQVYKRICKVEIPAVINAIEKAVGKIDLLGMAYRLNYDHELPNQAIHADTGWGSHALVLYLCNGPGGTAFWEHRATKERCILEGEDWLRRQIENDFDDVSKWYRHHLVHLKYNRALIYESSLFHSRYPFQAFGEDAVTGRLIVVAFFNLRKGS